jgi:hypothetical protein
VNVPDARSLAVGHREVVGDAHLPYRLDDHVVQQYRLVALVFALTSCLVVLCCLAAGCAGSSEPSDPLWTERQAESITTVRSMPVRVVRCRGLVDAEESEDTYRRFACLAGARAPWETYDTIAVSYILHPLGEYEGPRSPHHLSNVRFVGGPGVP